MVLSPFHCGRGPRIGTARPCAEPSKNAPYAAKEDVAPGNPPCMVMLWVPNSSSTAVTSSVARRWLSCVIVDRGAATAVSELSAAGGAWLGLLARVRGRQTSEPPDKRNANRQQKYATTPDVATGHDHRMAWSHRARIATDLLRHNYRESSTPYRATTEINKGSIAAHQTPPHPHAAMTGRSSLLAAVMPIPAEGGGVSLITGPDGHTPVQATTSSPTAQKKT